MTPFQFANSYCANHEGHGCSGLGIGDDLRTVRLWAPRDRCTVDQERCTYFETCVLAQVQTLDSGFFRDSVRQACDLYLRRLPVDQRHLAKIAIFGPGPDGTMDKLVPSRKCPNCGRPLEARRRLCELCAKAKRREAYRLANSKRGSEYNS